MNKKLSAFGLSILILALLVATALGFLMGLSHPLPWISLALLGGVVYLHSQSQKKNYLVWKEEYSVGIEAIDNDHKKLLSLINQLQTASTNYTGVDFERSALDELVNYTKYHFVREEKLLEENGYPGFEPHKKEHEAMVAEVMDKVSHYESNEDQTIDELLVYLKQWLINHISGTDQQYSSFLRDKGVR
ncbi:MAG: bacteriohemerythrin [Motiliproteus sp.]|nr:bacteriohemerythrin [Motiliproteus sp.]MCW9051323.1 bacteriohemerythrin [Motiliproteus sp.]